MRRHVLLAVGVLVGAVGILVGVHLIGQQLTADLMRAVAIPMAVVTFAVSVRVAVDHRYRSGTQLCRFLGLAILCLALALGQYHNLGREPYWPVLIPLWIGLALSLAGTAPLIWTMFDSPSLRDDESRML